MLMWLLNCLLPCMPACLPEYVPAPLLHSLPTYPSLHSSLYFFICIRDRLPFLIIFFRISFFIPSPCLSLHSQIFLSPLSSRRFFFCIFSTLSDLSYPSYNLKYLLLIQISLFCSSHPPVQHCQICPPFFYIIHCRTVCDLPFLSSLFFVLAHSLLFPHDQSSHFLQHY